MEDTGFPAIIRPSFTMGGVGGGIAYNIEEFKEICGRGLELSPVHEVLIEESVIGWKEFELEVMRDVADNFVVICSIENIDPMGVHTGDSITVAPALTLTDKEYQRMRDAGRRIIRRVGVETGGSNIQFAINPADGRMVIIEMNPRVSRSSALASKATGFPIAKIAAKLALGYHLDEIPNDITRLTPASFEPTIDYVVVKIPRWNFEKFPQADRTLTTQMKSVGEAMAIGRTFKEAFLKGIRSLELGNREGRLFGQAPAAGARPDAATAEELDAALRRRLSVPTDRRMWAVFEALERGWSLERIHELTKIDPWFLQQFADLVELRRTAEMIGLRDMSPDLLRTLKRAGFGDGELAHILQVDESAVREKRSEQGLRPVYKRIDTCAAEFESFTPYMYSTLRAGLRGRADRGAQGRHPRQRAQPHRPGHRVRLLLLSRRLRLPQGRLRDGDDQLQPGDRLDRLRHRRPALLRAADLRGRDGGDRARARGQRRRVGAWCSSAARRRSSWRCRCRRPASPSSAPRPIRSTWPRIASASRSCSGISASRSRPAAPRCRATRRARRPAQIGFPVVVRPSYVLGGRGMAIVYDMASLDRYMATAVDVSNDRPILIDRFLEHAKELDVDCVADATGAVVIGGIMEHIEEAGIHSGDSSCVVPPTGLSERHLATLRDYTRRIARALKVVGLMNVQYALKDDEIFVLEVNPRASRTIPYLAKATGVAAGAGGGAGDDRQDARRAGHDRGPGRRPGSSSRPRCSRSSASPGSTRSSAPR